MNSSKRCVMIALACMAFGALPLRTAASTGATANSVIDGAKARKIDRLLQSYDREGLLNGTVLVADRGKEVCKRGFGFANMEFRVPNAPNTKFRTASISKPIVACLALRLVAEGKLSLDTRVSDLLPDYRRDVADKVTVRHLLSHTSGIPDTLVIPGIWEREIRDPFTPQEILARYSKGGLLFEPGSKLKYGTLNYLLLSLMIEKATGKPFDQALREYIFVPAGMRDTGVEGASATVEPDSRGQTVLKGATPVISRLATGYLRTDNGFSRPPFMDMTHAAVGGSIYSTVEDLFSLDRVLYSDRLLPKPLRDQMFTPVLQDTGLGWNVREFAYSDLQRPFLNIVDPPNGTQASPAEFKIVYKLGDLWGYSGAFVRHVNEEHTVIILTNAAMRGVYFDLNTVSIWQAIASILYNRPYFTPREHLFAEAIRDRGYERAVAMFKQLKKEEPHSPIIREYEFDVLGRELLANRNTRLALDVFRLNVEAHPLSLGVHHGLAEAYVQSGNREMGASTYQKLLDLIANDRSSDAGFKDRLKNEAQERLRQLKE